PDHLHPGRRGGDGFLVRLEIGEVLGRRVVGVVVGLVADLDTDQARSEDLCRVRGLVGGALRVRVLEVDPVDDLPAAVLYQRAEALQVSRGDRGNRPARRLLAGRGPERGVDEVAAETHHTRTEGLHVLGQRAGRQWG